MLVVRKDRKTVTAEAEKDGTFLDVTIDAILLTEYVRVQKVMKSVASKLWRWRDIENVVG